MIPTVLLAHKEKGRKGTVFHGGNIYVCTGPNANLDSTYIAPDGPSVAGGWTSVAWWLARVWFGHPSSTPEQPRARPAPLSDDRILLLAESFPPYARLLIIPPYPRDTHLRVIRSLLIEGEDPPPGLIVTPAPALGLDEPVCDVELESTSEQPSTATERKIASAGATGEDHPEPPLKRYTVADFILIVRLKGLGDEIECCRRRHCN